MRWNAKNGYVPIGDTEMSYVSFGTGEKILAVLPGLLTVLIILSGLLPVPSGRLLPGPAAVPAGLHRRGRSLVRSRVRPFRPGRERRGADDQGGCRDRRK